MRRVGEAINGAKMPVFYLEIPPFLFGPVVKRLSEAGLTEHARVVVEKPFGHDQDSARALAEELHQYIDESQLYRIDHYLGKMGLEEILAPPVRERDPRAAVEPHTTSTASRSRWPRSFGVEDRGHFYDPVGALRDVVVNHLMQVVAAAAMEPPSRATRPRSRSPRSRCSVPSSRPTRRTTSAVSTTGYRGIDGVAAGSRPRPTRRCGSTSRTGAGPACRSSSAPGSGSPRPRPSSGWCSSGRLDWASGWRGQPSRTRSWSSSTPRRASGSRWTRIARTSARIAPDRARHGVRGRGR